MHMIIIITENQILGDQYYENLPSPIIHKQFPKWKWEIRSGYRIKGLPKRQETILDSDQIYFNRR